MTVSNLTGNITQNLKFVKRVLVTVNTLIFTSFTRNDQDVFLTIVILRYFMTPSLMNPIDSPGESTTSVSCPVESWTTLLYVNRLLSMYIDSL